ncbi:MAG TPA: hypothetical protein VFK02_10805 [Kofleriaceae bacterium]|nr:hypothetical protein [Kofleriaceae bacterium]
MTKTLAFILTASLAACAGEAEVRYSGTVTEPEMVALETDPGVMVVANADEPVFYVDNTYWLYRDHRWYSSHSHRGGWARIDQPPEHVRRIQRPEVYVHYRHSATTPRTTLNERRDMVPTPRAEPRDMREPDIRDPRDQRRDQGPREPNPQGPTQPYPNPLPPQQVPPSSPDHPDHPITPSPDRAGVSPGNDRKNDRKEERKDDRRDRKDDREDRKDDRKDEHDTKRGPHPDEH